MTLNSKQARFLGIDYGTKKTGLAVTGPLGLICIPLKTVSTKKVVEELRSLVDEYEISKIVVGWPLLEDGSKAKITRTVEDFVGNLKKKFKETEVVIWDERYSSMRAREILVESGVKKKKRESRGAVDAMAAVVILEEYLEANPFSDN